MHIQRLHMPVAQRLRAYERFLVGPTRPRASDREARLRARLPPSRRGAVARRLARGLRDRGADDQHYGA